MLLKYISNFLSIRQVFNLFMNYYCMMFPLFYTWMDYYYYYISILASLREWTPIILQPEKGILCTPKVKTHWQRILLLLLAGVSTWQHPLLLDLNPGPLVCSQYGLIPISHHLGIKGNTLVPWYLAQFNTNYIIFRNVEIFKKLFLSKSKKILWRKIVNI